MDDVSRAIKAIDSRHLVSTGFTNERLRDLKFMAPEAHAEWDTYEKRREAVINIHKLPGIAFVTFHVYGGNPDLQTDASFFTEKWKSEVTWYFDEMTRIKEELGKPVVCEEFGVQRQVGEPARKEIYEFYFGQVLRQKMSSCFNGWADDKWPNCLAIYTYDDEYGTIKDAAARIKN